jgi:CRISPR-associated protein Csx10
MTTTAETRRIVWLRISPLSPLQLGDHTGVGNFQSSVDFIPGSSLRGTVAQKLLAGKTGSFEALFEGAEPYFGNGYLGSSAPVWPFPLTARTCKRYGGLSSGETEDNRKHHGVIDVLAADFAYDLIGDPEFPHRNELQPEDPEWAPHHLPGIRSNFDRCSAKIEPGSRECRVSMIPATGYYTWMDKPLQTKRPTTTVMTHVGINRARGVAQDQLLFSQERLLVQETLQSFFARVFVPEAKVERLIEAAEGEHFIGRGRSRGNGRVVIQALANVDEPSLDDRLLDFKLALIGALQPYAARDPRVATDLPGVLFSITLTTPAILHDAGRPLRVPPARFLGLSNSEDIPCIRAWARTEPTGGWDSAAGMPRRKMLAVRAGSVFLYWARPTVDADRLREELGRAESEGIGDERERGYGQFLVCAPFHYMEHV